MKCLLTRRTFSSWILSLNISILCFLNSGFEWQPLRLKTNNYRGLLLKDKQIIYNIKNLSPNHISLIDMWVKDCIVDSFQCINIDKIPDLKKESICPSEFYCNINNVMFSSIHIFINSNAKIFSKICGIELFSTKFNLNFTVYLLTLMFENYWHSFLQIERDLICIWPISYVFHIKIRIFNKLGHRLTKMK